jgi:hypothetical protein
MSSATEWPVLLGSGIRLLKRDFLVISSMSDFSLVRFRSASLSVTPNHLVRNTMESLLREVGRRPQLKLAMNLIAVMLGRKQ